MTEFIAEREWIAVRPTGEQFPLVIRVGKPYRVNDVAWACPVEAKGLYKSLADIQGIDSLQALNLALSFLHNLVTGFKEKGGKVLWPEDNTEVDTNELFSSQVGEEPGVEPEKDDRIRTENGVVACLRDLGDGTSRIILDDVKTKKATNPTSWDYQSFYTWNRYKNESVESMSMSDVDFKNIGVTLLARLLASSGRL